MFIIIHISFKLKYLNPQYYADLVEERAINGFCGYALCSGSIERNVLVCYLYHQLFLTLNIYNLAQISWTESVFKFPGKNELFTTLKTERYVLDFTINIRTAKPRSKVKTNSIYSIRIFQFLIFIYNLYEYIHIIFMYEYLQYGIWTLYSYCTVQ